MTEKPTSKGLIVICSNCKKEINLETEQAAVYTEGEQNGHIVCMKCYDPNNPIYKDVFTDPELAYHARRQMTDRQNKHFNEKEIKAYWKYKNKEKI